MSDIYSSLVYTSRNERKDEMKKNRAGALCLMASFALVVSALMTGAGCNNCKPADATLSWRTSEVSALNVSNIHHCPSNNKRKMRSSTELIVLHTTEALARSSLNKLSECGEAHYFVTEEGTVYRIVDRDREAFHAGRSLWNGKEDLDRISIGIACVGYHDKDMGSAQLSAIRGLVKELQRMYNIPDECVVSHAHVAYGTPNRWQKENHRGRKRCGMLFAKPDVRRQIGLERRPEADPDVLAKRLVADDDYLQRILYGNGGAL